MSGFQGIKIISVIQESLLRFHCKIFLKAKPNFEVWVQFHKFFKAYYQTGLFSMPFGATELKS